MNNYIHLMTSGHFNAGSIKCALREMGADRIMDARLTIHVTPPKILLIVDEDFEPGAP